MLKIRWLCLALLAVAGCEGASYNSGDRVLVAKCLYETQVRKPARFDVVVFKFPAGPMKDNVPTNYIKRLMGLPGEMIAIFFGQLFRMTPPDGAPLPGLPEGVNPLDLWKEQPSGPEFKEKFKEWFDGRKFEIVRKPPEIMLAMRRLVNDNNFHPADMKMLPSRWQPAAGSGWTMSPDRKTFSFKPAEGNAVDWLTYRHLVRPVDRAIAGNVVLKPRLITDSMGYNDFNLHDPNKRSGHSVNWVGDLMLEADVSVKQPTGEFLMELSRGANRFQAKWDLASGQCTLVKIDAGGQSRELGSAATAFRGAGTHSLRFANFDSRLTVWVDRELPFGDGVAYDPPEFDGAAQSGPTKNDLERPASLGCKGAVLDVANLRLWRDTYYTMSTSHADLHKDRWTNFLTPEALADPESWGPFKDLTPAPFYVYPGHYLCLGDNSTQSSDSRYWGLVPDRLMLGRALMVYYPLNRIGLIR